LAAGELYLPPSQTKHFDSMLCSAADDPSSLKNFPAAQSLQLVADDELQVP
jgi:hypothetical protein